MTIREAEQRTGLDRATIRFYEKEGLISPKRQENGYRDYGEADITALLRIKLLRDANVDLRIPMERALIQIGIKLIKERRTLKNGTAIKAVGKEYLK